MMRSKIEMGAWFASFGYEIRPACAYAIRRWPKAKYHAVPIAHDGPDTSFASLQGMEASWRQRLHRLIREAEGIARFRAVVSTLPADDLDAIVACHWTKTSALSEPWLARLQVPAVRGRWRTRGVALHQRERQRMREHVPWGFGHQLVMLAETEIARRFDALPAATGNKRNRHL
jgi:hypothetical protein